MPTQVKRFIYVPRYDLCDHGANGGVEVYELKNAAFPKLVGAQYAVTYDDMQHNDAHRRHAINILEEHAKIRVTKERKISSKNVDLRCIGD